jgi:hypothetical protein
MLINFTNHPNEKWSEKQKQLAIAEFGQIVDMPFPEIEPHAGTAEIKLLAELYFTRLVAHFDHCASTPKANAVHIQGEFTFAFALVKLLQSCDIKCLASTSKRIVQEKDGRKLVLFDFVQFRAYL